MRILLLYSTIFSARQSVDSRLAYLHDTPREVYTKNSAVNLVSTLAQMLTGGKAILVELAGLSALALELPMT